MNAAQFNALIKKAREKDEYAIGILYKYCLKVITMHLTYRFSSISEVEDLACDVITYKILEQLPDFYVSCPSAWLCKVSDNYVKTKLKRDSRIVELSENVPVESCFENIANKIMLEQELKGIDETTARILVLNSHFGYTFDEIGQLLGMKPATARKRISRMRIDKNIQNLKNKE